MILNLVPPTRYTFDQVGLGQTLTVQLVSNIDVSSAREVTLICRLHGKNLTGTGTPELMLLGRRSTNGTKMAGLPGLLNSFPQR
jgi:hypothetical protein